MDVTSVNSRDGAGTGAGDKAVPVDLMGMEFARLDGDGLCARILDDLKAGRGGWLVTANLDILRRHVVDPASAALYGQADLVVADGMPLVWASRVLGDPLPERIAGSSMTVPLCRQAAAAGRRVYLMGDEAEVNEAAAARLKQEIPALQIVGRSSPWVSLPPTPEELAPLADELRRTAPDLVLVAMGSPKQEHVIAAMRATLPSAWWVGVGISLSFVAGNVQRAPAWAQRFGLEWLHRLIQEPRRLARRYLVDDLPFAFVLFASVARRRSAALRRRD